MSKQTAVEWLIEQIYFKQVEVNRELLDQALEMEKQQIIDANRDGTDMVIVDGTPFITGEQYFFETFNK
jgi:hypothetical protein